MSALATDDRSRRAVHMVRRGAGEVPLVVVAVMLVASAVQILPGDNLFGVGQVRFSLARILILVGLGAVVVAEGPRLELFRTRLGLPLALLLGVSLVSSHKWGTYAPYRFLVEGVALFYLTFATIRARPDARDAIALLALVVASIVAFDAVAQVSQGDHTGFYRDGCTPVTLSPASAPPSGSITRALGPFGNPNVLAGYLLLVLPVGALAGTVVARARGAYAPLAVAMVLGYLALVFTFSRAGVLVGIVAVGAGALFTRAHQRVYLALVVVALVAAIAFLSGSCGSEATSGFGRTQEWRETFDVIRDHPVWGIGLGRLGDVLHARNSLSTARHAHNLWLTWWAEAGTGALVAWIWIAVALLWRSLRGALAGDVFARSAFVAMLGFFAFSLFDHPANVQQVAVAFWIVAGVAAATGVPGLPRPFRRRAASPSG